MSEHRHSVHRGRGLPALALVVACLASLAPVAAQQIVSGGCLEDVSPHGVNCTANDVTFVLVGLGAQTDGCVQSGLGFCSNDDTLSCVDDSDCVSPGTCDYLDEVDIFLRAIVQNTTAQARYDVGLWFASDGDPSICSSSICTGGGTTACDENVDCPSGETCEAHVRCVVDADCSALGLGTCEASDGARRGSCGRTMLSPAQLAYCSGDDPTGPTGPACSLHTDCPGAETCQVIGHCSTTTTTGCFFDADCPGGESCEAPGCPGLDLLGGGGPYLSNEPATPQGSGSPIDTCGDLFDENTDGCDTDGDGNWDDSIMDFIEAQTFPCSDIDADGFINIPTCSSWGNEDSEVHLGTCVGGTDVGNFCTADNNCGGGGTCTDSFVSGGDFPYCDSAWEVINGTPAKCNCENVNSNIPAPNLDLTCSCNTGNTGVVPPGAQVLCTVEFENTVACTNVSQCSGNGAFCTVTADCPGNQTCDVVPEEFQCGAARYVRFETDDTLADTSDAGGSFAVNSTISASATGNGDLQITPISASGTDYVVGASHTGSVEFWYTVPDGQCSVTTTTSCVGDSDCPSGETCIAAPTIDLTTETYWSNDGQCSVTTTTTCTADGDCPMGETCVASFASETLQSLSAVCPINVEPDWVSVSELSATRIGRDVVVEWQTDSEVGTLSFHLYRQDPRSGRFVQVNQRPLSALQQTGGALYRVIDDGASVGRRATYSIVETNLQGVRQSIGPFEVTVRQANDVSAWDSFDTAKAFAPSKRHARRVEEARREERESRAAARSQGPSGLRRRVPVKASIEATNVYRVTAAELADLWQMTESKVRDRIQLGHLQLVNRGNEIAWLAGPGFSEIYFFGERLESLFSRHNVYGLDADHGPTVSVISAGHPIPTASTLAFDDRVHREQDLLPAVVVALDPESDYWFWDGIIAQSADTVRTFEIQVDDPANTGPAELTIGLWGATDDPLIDPEHHAIVRLNSVEIGSVVWDGLGDHSASFAFDPAILVDGGNVVEVEAVLDAGVSNSLFFIDSFDVDYSRLYRAAGDRLRFRTEAHDVVTVAGFGSDDILVFEITDPLQPKLVANTTIDLFDGEYRVSLTASGSEAEFFAVTRGAVAAAAIETDRQTIDLRQFHGADYVVIAPAQLVDAATELADYRASAGFDPVVVDLAEIYSQFNDGIESPHAIADFIAFAYENWMMKPSYVVLAGAASFDYKDNQGHGGNLVPTLMVSTPWGLFSSDLAYGDVVADDAVPEVAVGRLPVFTAAELSAYVAKLSAYEASSGSDWRERALMLSDDPDEAGDFPADSEAVEVMLAPPLTASRVSLADLPLAEARQQMFTQLAEGVGFVNYVGHGGATKMAQEGLLTIDDVPGLENSEQPIVASATCVIGRYAVPGFESLAEALVLEPDGGSVAVWSPSGLSYSVDARLLNRAFADAGFSAPGATLGEAVLEALERYEGLGFFEHMLSIYNVLGDPALAMQ